MRPAGMRGTIRIVGFIGIALRLLLHRSIRPARAQPASVQGAASPGRNAAATDAQSKSAFGRDRPLACDKKAR